MRGFFADNSFFKVFSYELEQGNKNNALLSPNSIVITKPYAQQLFKDENPIDKSVHFVDRGLSTLGDDPGNSQVDWGLYTVTGVIAEGNHKSHIKFDALVSSSSRDVLIEEKKLENNSYSWSNNSSYTYVLLKDENQKDALSNSLNNLVKLRPLKNWPASRDLHSSRRP